MASAIDEPRLLRALLPRRLFCQHVGQQRDRFDIDTLPAIVGHGDNGNAVGGNALIARNIDAVSGDHHARAGPRRRKAVVAGRHPARDLQIDDAVAHPVSPYAFVHHDREGGLRHRHLDAELLERALEAGHVAALIDHAAAPHLADLVDAVGELVAPVLDVHHGFAMRPVAAVHVGEAGHLNPSRVP